MSAGYVGAFYHSCDRINLSIVKSGQIAQVLERLAIPLAHHLCIRILIEHIQKLERISVVGVIQRIVRIAGYVTCFLVICGEFTDDVFIGFQFLIVGFILIVLHDLLRVRDDPFRSFSRLRAEIILVLHQPLRVSALIGLIYRNLVLQRGNAGSGTVHRVIDTRCKTTHFIIPVHMVWQIQHKTAEYLFCIDILVNVVTNRLFDRVLACAILQRDLD